MKVYNPPIPYFLPSSRSRSLSSLPIPFSIFVVKPTSPSRSEQFVTEKSFSTHNPLLKSYPSGERERDTPVPVYNINVFLKRHNINIFSKPVPVSASEETRSPFPL